MGQATDDSKGRGHHILDTQGYRYTLSGCVILIALSQQLWLHERAPTLRHTLQARSWQSRLVLHQRHYLQQRSSFSMTVRQARSSSMLQLSWYLFTISGVPGRGGWEVQPPPPKFRRPNSTRLWKLLKIAEFRTPTPEDIRKKGSEILKLPSVRILFYISNDK